MTDSDEVILCYHCGDALQDIEHDIFREDTKNHRCREMVEARVVELESALTAAVEYMASRATECSQPYPLERCRTVLASGIQQKEYPND